MIKNHKMDLIYFFLNEIIKNSKKNWLINTIKIVKNIDEKLKIVWKKKKKKNKINYEMI